jgi:hypothetical protein
MHGGKNTGPRTAVGVERGRQATWKHRFYSRETVESRRAIREDIAERLKLLEALRARAAA